MLIPFGVVLFGRVVVFLFRQTRSYLGGDYEYSYRIPQLGAWGTGYESVSRALSDAESYVEKETNV